MMRKPSDCRDRGNGKPMLEISERDFDEEVLECELPVFTCFTSRGADIVF